LSAGEGWDSANSVAMTRAVALALLLSVAAAQGAPLDALSAFRTAAKAGLEAEGRGDLAAAEAAFDTAAAAAPQREGLIHALALVAAQRGETAKAMALLERYAGMGGTADVAREAKLGALRSLPGFAALATKIAHNARPHCDCRTLYRGGGAPILAEGIAGDGERIFVAAVHRRAIFSLRHGRLSIFVASLPDGLSPFGIAVDRARRRLWVSAASLPQSEGASELQRGHSALLAYDLQGAGLLAEFSAPDAKALGDVTLGPDGTVYISDGSDGALYRLASGAAALEPVLHQRMLASAQGMSASPDGRYLLVADYAMGLMRVDLRTLDMQPVVVPPDVTTLGIDGMVRLADGSFAATQNGAPPYRVLRFALSADWSVLTAFSVLAANAPAVSDPALLATDGRSLDVIGVSQWSAFDDDKPEPVRPVPAWRVVRIPVPQTRYSSRS